MACDASCCAPASSDNGASQLICVSTIRGRLECSATNRLTSSDQMRARCSRSALPMTDTELNDIAAAATIGLSLEAALAIPA
jgi:hypothetical protein